MSEFKVVRLLSGEKIMYPSEKFGCQLKPTKLYVFPEGTVDNQVSLTLELEGPGGRIFVAQISLKMLLKGIEAGQDVEALKAQIAGLNVRK